MTQDPNAKARARELHAELVGVHGDDCAPMCCKTIAQALRDADQRGYERGVEDAKMVAAGFVGVMNPRAVDILVEAIRALVPEREGK